MSLTIRSQSSSPRHPHAPRRAGMTLLEIMLALSLMVLVIIAFGMAIQMNLHTLNSRRSTVEEAQLARAVLRMISPSSTPSLGVWPSPWS